MKLIGYTDNVGSARFNQRLSLERARVIGDYLIEKGIDESRIEIEGRGLAEPMNQNTNDQERALNRRVEMTIFYQE